MGHPILEIGPAEQDRGDEHHDLEHDVVEPMPRERGVGTLHRFSLQAVVPSFLSSSSTPRPVSSSRMRSASLKFLVLRAALRSAISPSTRASSIATLAGRQAAHSAAPCCSSPMSCALALRQAAAPAEPLAASLRSS